MTRSSMTDFLILYGSQTGQAQAISEEIFDRAHKQGFSPRRFCLSQVEKKFSLVKETCVLFVCSTTGEGEPPDTASKFFRRLKKKTLPNNHLENLSFAFLALGDSNYTNFCNCGKNLDARLLNLGAKHFYDTGYADDAVGLEIVVEPWIENLFPALRKYAGLSSLENPDTEVKMDTTAENHSAEKITKEISPPVVPQNIVGNDNVIIDTEKENVVDISTLYRSISSLSTAALKIPSCPDAYIEAQFLETEELNENSKPTHPSSATDVYQVPILSARQLTNDPVVKKALELELDVSKIDFDFQPGDSFGIVCQNKLDEVEYLVQRLGFKEIADKTLTLQIKKDTKKKAPTIPDHITLPSTLRKILTNDTDFRAVPRKAFLRMLVDYTEDAHEKRRLQELASVQGGKEYTAFVREQNVGLVEMLKVFTTCKPPVERILEFLPRLLPREYSIANSPLNNKKNVKFVFNVIQFSDFEGKQRFGLCTKWLQEITKNLTSGQSSEVASENADISKLINKLAINEQSQMLNIYFRRPTNFRFPDDPTRPMILIGPGTGIAPFIGYLEHRTFFKVQSPDLSLGEAIVFYGCRYQNKDFLYRSELNNFLSNGTLNQLHTSFSRDEPTNPDNTKYVQDNIRKYKQDVLRMVFENDGAVYICGDAKHMGRDVTNTFVELIEEYKGLSKMNAIKMLNGLRETKQFLEDVWT